MSDDNANPLGFMWDQSGETKGKFFPSADDLIETIKLLAIGRLGKPPGGVEVKIGCEPSASVTVSKTGQKMYHITVKADWIDQVGNVHWRKMQELPRVARGPCEHGLAIVGWHFVLEAKRLDPCHADGRPVFALTVVHKHRGYKVSVHKAFAVLCGWSWGFGWTIKAAKRASEKAAAKALGVKK